MPYKLILLNGHAFTGLVKCSFKSFKHHHSSLYSSLKWKRLFSNLCVQPLWLPLVSTCCDKNLIDLYCIYENDTNIFWDIIDLTKNLLNLVSVIQKNVSICSTYIDEIYWHFLEADKVTYTFIVSKTSGIHIAGSCYDVQ